MNKDLLSFSNMTVADFETVWRRTDRLKNLYQEGREHASLKGKTLGMITSVNRP